MPGQFQHDFAELPRGINRGSLVGEAAKSGLDALIFVKKKGAIRPVDALLVIA